MFSCSNLALVKGMYALIGRNGTGKSTFLSSILGERSIKEGVIELADAPITTLSAEKLARTVSIVRSRPLLYGDYKVRDILMLGRLPYQGMLALPSSTDEEKVLETANKLGLFDFLERDYNSLSDGEKQLVMVGRAIVQDTPVILLDEPSAFLDLVNRIELLKHLRKLADEHNKLILFSTHHIEILSKYCDGILLISQQQLNLISDKEKFEPEISQAFGIENL